MFNGRIQSIGPRYCPSIEDKIDRFADKDSHQIFVEPEGLQSIELYPNGISTSLPFDVQLSFVQSIVGFENAHIVRPGYAIEYDFFNPQDLFPTLETKLVSGLYFAGQINGTTGYEEAGAQGLLAGTNAALKALDKEPWTARRDQAYLGVIATELRLLKSIFKLLPFSTKISFSLIVELISPPKLSGVLKLYLYFGKYTGEIF